MNQTTQDPQATAAEQNVPGFVRYFQAQQMQVPKALYEAVALELTSRFPADTLRMWCRVLGQQWAMQARDAYAQAGDLPTLADALNAYWAQAGWGWVYLEESEHGLEVHHQASPLPQGFGVQNLGWGIGLLEGFYDTVFKQLGAADDMRVDVTQIAVDGFDLHFQFSA